MGSRLVRKLRNQTVTLRTGCQSLLVDNCWADVGLLVVGIDLGLVRTGLEADVHLVADTGLDLVRTGLVPLEDVEVLAQVGTEAAADVRLEAESDLILLRNSVGFCYL